MPNHQQPVGSMNSQSDDIASVERISDAYQDLRSQVSKIIVGQDSVVDEILIALFAGGHCLLVGAPGLAKNSACQHGRRRRSPWNSSEFNLLLI